MVGIGSSARTFCPVTRSSGKNGLLFRSNILKANLARRGQLRENELKKSKTRGFRGRG
jgi:hypothetical protein